jgi:predicted dehydrogenase
MNNEQKISVAVIGVGYWGPNLVRNLLDINEVGKVFVFDLNLRRSEALKKKFSNLAVAYTFNEILSNPEIKATVVATPVNKHFEIAKQCLLAGKNVLVEKPLAQNSAECEALVKLAEEKNVKLMVGHLLEYKPSVVQIKNMVQKGDVGNMLYISASRLNLGLIRSDVSVLWDSAVHDIYTINFILGKLPKRVSAVGAKYPEYTGVNLDTVAFLVLDYGDNVLAHIHINWLSPYKYRKMTISGTKKMVLYDDIDLIEPIRIYDVGVEPQDENLGAPDLTYRVGDTIIPNVPNKEALRAECEHFIDCVINNKKPQSDGVEGLNTVKIIESAEESMRNESKFIEIKYQ